MNVTDLKGILQKKERAIFRMIYQHKEISRPELLSISNLKIATLYRTIDSLAEKGLITVTRPEDVASVGRPSDILAVNGSYGYFVSIAVRRFSYRIAIVDFADEIVLSGKYRCDKSTTPDELVVQCHLHYREFLSSLQLPEDKVMGVAISSFGVPVFSLRQNIRPIYPGFSWGDYNIVEGFGAVFDRPAHFEYGARAAAYGNYIHKYFPQYDSLAYIIIDEGIGTGIIINQNMIYGDNRIINGLGHMVVDVNGEKCVCGKYGCLETQVCATSIVRNALAELRLGKPSTLRSLADTLTHLDVCRAADSGDALARHVMEHAAHIFSIGMENFLNILDIHMIVLGGTIPLESTYFFEIVKTRLENSLPGIHVERDEAEREMSLRGCAAGYILTLLEDS